MIKIQIDDLHVPGFELLSSEESYLNEINDSEFDLTRGGATTSPVCASLAMSYLFYKTSEAARKIHDKNEGIISPL
jgi:hypothetical protein